MVGQRFFFQKVALDIFMILPLNPLKVTLKKGAPNNAIKPHALPTFTATAIFKKRPLVECTIVK